MKIYTFKNNILAAEWIIDYKRGRIDGQKAIAIIQMKKNVGFDYIDNSRDGEKWLFWDLFWHQSQRNLFLIEHEAK